MLSMSRSINNRTVPISVTAKTEGIKMEASDSDTESSGSSSDDMTSRSQRRTTDHSTPPTSSALPGGIEARDTSRPATLTFQTELIPDNPEEDQTNEHIMSSGPGEVFETPTEHPLTGLDPVKLINESVNNTQSTGVSLDKDENKVSATEAENIVSETQKLQEYSTKQKVARQTRPSTSSTSSGSSDSSASLSSSTRESEPSQNGQQSRLRVSRASDLQQQTHNQVHQPLGSTGCNGVEKNACKGNEQNPQLPKVAGIGHQPNSIVRTKSQQSVTSSSDSSSSSSSYTSVSSSYTDDPRGKAHNESTNNSRDAKSVDVRNSSKHSSNSAVHIHGTENKMIGKDHSNGTQIEDKVTHKIQANKVAAMGSSASLTSSSSSTTGSSDTSGSSVSSVSGKDAAQEKMRYNTKGMTDMQDSRKDTLPIQKRVSEIQQCAKQQTTQERHIETGTNTNGADSQTSKHIKHLPPQTLSGFRIQNPDIQPELYLQTETAKGRNQGSANNSKTKASDQPITKPIQKLNGFQIDNTDYEQYYSKMLPPLPIRPYNSAPIETKAPTTFSVLPDINSNLTYTVKAKKGQWTRKLPILEHNNKVQDEKVAAKEEHDKQRRLRNCLIISIIVIALMAGAIALLIFFVVRNNDSNDNKDKGTFTCDDGSEIEAFSQCDGFEDCVGGEDEHGCDCHELEWSCGLDGPCILDEWRCDGIGDCPDGRDESRCGLSCSAGEFACEDHSVCISSELLCDGTRSCSDGSDEWDCAMLSSTSVLQALAVSGSYLPVCVEGWDTSLAQLVCTQLGYGDLVDTNIVVAQSTDSFMEVWDTVGDNVVFRETQVCPSNEVVELQCAYNECGTVAREFRGSSRQQRIVGGDNADPGAWPWQIALLYRDEFICGGSLLYDGWMVTAAHCVENDPLGPENFRVRLGSHLVSESDSNAVTARVQRIHMHQDYNTRTLENDLALLRLFSDVTLTDYIRPICLPSSPAENFNTSVECFTTGWGAFDEDSRDYPEHLQQARIRLLTDSECNANEDIVHEGGVEEDVMLCAGYPHHLISVCNGDSGGPLVCRDSRHVWTLAGITSWGYGDHRRECTGISIFTEVAYYVDWIDSLMTS